MAEKPIPNARPRFALLMALIAALLGAGFVLLSTRGVSSLPIRDVSHDSVPSILLQTSILVGVVITAISLRRFNPDRDPMENGSRLEVIFVWISRVVVILSIVFVLALFLTVLFYPISRLTTDRTLSSQFLLVIAVIYTAALGFALAYWTSALDYLQLLWFTTTLMILGLAGAILLAPDSSWWTGVLSFLGTDSSGWIFNLTFILGGWLVLMVIQDKLDDLEFLREAGKFQEPRFSIYHRVLVINCFAIMGIGIFPFAGVTVLFHQIFATFAVLSFLFFGPAFMYLLPIYSPLARRLSLLPTIIALLSAGGYFLAVLTFSLDELIFIGLIVVWVVVFYYGTRAYILKVNPVLEQN